MSVNDIIVLDNNERYTLLKDTMFENNTYFLAAVVDENEHINYKKIAILKLIKEHDGDYVEVVSDETLIVKLSKAFEASLKD